MPAPRPGWGPPGGGRAAPGCPGRPSAGPRRNRSAGPAGGPAGGSTWPRGRGSLFTPTARPRYGARGIRPFYLPQPLNSARGDRVWAAYRPVRAVRTFAPGGGGLTPRPAGAQRRTPRGTGRPPAAAPRADPVPTGRFHDGPHV